MPHSIITAHGRSKQGALRGAFFISGGMMPQIVPLTAVPSQTLSVMLNGQGANINVYQKNSSLYFDLYVGTSQIIAGVLCRNNVYIQQTPYLGFIGDLRFIDTQAGPSTPPLDPVYTGLGARFILIYETPAEISAAQTS
jgi:hypothetical protein